MNDLQVFSNPQFGELRSIKGELYRKLEERAQYLCSSWAN